MKTVLFVCTGNTCRSPMAAALFNRWQDPDFLALSAGTNADYGDGMSQNALEALRFAATASNARNPFAKHRSHPVNEELLQKADLVICLSFRHKELLSLRYPQHRDKLHCLSNDIPDPYGGDLSRYLSCLSRIRQGVDALYRTLRGDADGIFPMIESDLDRVSALENACFSTPWSRDSFLASLRSPTTHPLILQKSGKIVGYAVYSVMFETAELYNIAIDPAVRGQGLGSILLQDVIRRCRTADSETLFLEVRRSNESARALYEKHRFVYDSVRKNYYKNPTEDALLMHLTWEE